MNPFDHEYRENEQISTDSPVGNFPLAAIRFSHLDQHAEFPRVWTRAPPHKAGIRAWFNFPLLACIVLYTDMK